MKVKMLLSRIAPWIIVASYWFILVILFSACTKIIVQDCSLKQNSAPMSGGK